MNLVLIDTCAWVNFFKSTTGQLGTEVVHLIETDQATTTGIVIAKLLQGIKTGKENQQLKRLFSREPVEAGRDVKRNRAQRAWTAFPRSAWEREKSFHQQLVSPY